MVIENDYVTIEEVMQPDQTLSQLENKTSSGHIHTLQVTSALLRYDLHLCA